jgi:hypothetical protein
MQKRKAKPQQPPAFLRSPAVRRPINNCKRNKQIPSSTQRKTRKANTADYPPNQNSHLAK